MKYVLVTDIPAPWREKVFERVHSTFGDEFHVVYCSHSERRRLWKFPLGNHPKTFLKCITIRSDNTKENFVNPGIVSFLLKHRPKVVICFSLVPTVFIAFAVAEALGCRVGMFADTWLGRDGQLSAMQRAMRRLACRYFAQAFVGASMQTLNWYRHYNGGVGTKPFFLSSLCADNEHFKKIRNETMVDRSYDLMFSGRIVTLKNPVFFAEVAVEVRRRFGKCRVLVIGDGDPRLKSKMFRILEDGGVDYHFPGFVKHLELPRYYCQSKLLLFPTSGDCWGVVINEALVSGVPVITTQMTAAAGELVLDGQNGYVLPLESGLWAEKAVTLLRDQDRWMAFSKSAEEMVESFTFEKAAQGIIDAFEYLARSN